MKTYSTTALPENAPPEKKPPSIGPVFLTLTFLAVASATYTVIRNSALMKPNDTNQTVELTDQDFTPTKRKLPTVPPLEAAPGPPIATPEMPESEASKAELWLYGERYLGWQSLKSIDLADHTEAELRGWLDQDRQLYDYDDSLAYGTLGYSDE